MIASRDQGRAAGGRLETVEFGRGLAALAVVVFHANAAADEFNGPQWRWPGFGEHGVDFFFVLSGFIIFFAHHADIGRAGAPYRYLLKRVIRLAPLLWLVVAGVAAMHVMAGLPPDAMLVARSLLPWPSLEKTLPQVVWTLRHEILFYAAFLVLLIRPAAGWAVFAAAGAASLVQAVATLHGAALSGVAAFLLSAFNLQFMMGALVAFAYLRGRVSGGWAVLIAAAAALAGALTIDDLWRLNRTATADYVSPVAAWWTIALGLMFAGLLWGMLAIERRVRVPRWALTLGGASYAIYLVHTPVNSLAQRIAAHLPDGVLAVGGGQILLVVCGTAAGVALHLYVERPVARWLRARLLPRPAPLGPVPTREVA